MNWIFQLCNYKWKLKDGKIFFWRFGEKKTRLYMQTHGESMLECQSLSNYYQMSIFLISGGDGFVIVIAKQ